MSESIAAYVGTVVATVLAELPQARVVVDQILILGLRSPRSLKVTIELIGRPGYAACQEFHLGELYKADAAGGVVPEALDHARGMVRFLRDAEFTKLAHVDGATIAFTGAVAAAILEAQPDAQVRFSHPVGDHTGLQTEVRCLAFQRRTVAQEVSFFALNDSALGSAGLGREQAKLLLAALRYAERESPDTTATPRTSS